MADQHIVLQKDTVHILRTIFLWRGTAYQRLGVRNYGDGAVDLQSRSCSRTILPTCSKCAARTVTRRGTAAANLRGADQALLNYHGLDGKVAAHHADLRSAAEPS